MTTNASAATQLAESDDIGAATGSLTHEIERLLSAGIGITTRAIDETAKAADLTLAQWRVLVVTAQGESVRVGELADRLGMSVPSTSRLVRRVEARRLVTATRALDDRRATDVNLTPAGRTLVEAVVGRRRELIQRALDDGLARQSPDAATLLHGLADRLVAHA
jgi:DNA-binding MarR family transcriptional regulator